MPIYSISNVWFVRSSSGFGQLLAVTIRGAHSTVPQYVNPVSRTAQAWVGPTPHIGLGANENNEASIQDLPASTSATTSGGACEY